MDGSTASKRADPSTLPGWLEAFVKVNPVTVLTDAARSVLEGKPYGFDISVSWAVAAAVTVVFAPITTRLYRKRVTGPPLVREKAPGGR